MPLPEGFVGITIEKHPNFIVVSTNGYNSASPALMFSKRTVRKPELNFVLDDDMSMIVVEIQQQTFYVSNKVLTEHPDALRIDSIDGVAVDQGAPNAETLFTQLLTLMP